MLRLDRSTAEFALAALLVSWCYAALRFHLNGEYSGATWEQLYQLTAPIPFGSRLLVPILSRPIVLLGFSIRDAYFFWEMAASFALAVGLRRVFQLHVGQKCSMVVSLTFFLVLPLIFLLRFRWSVYYPYDTAAMALVTWGILATLRGMWGPLIVLVLVATLNRESSILLIMLFAAIYADRLKLTRFIAVLAMLVVAYLAGRWLTHMITADNPMPYQGQLPLLLDDDWRFRSNVIWMLNLGNIPLLLSTLAGLPVLVLALKRHVPPHMRRFGIVALTYFSMLLFVGNLYEPRIFGEIVVILYIVGALATLRWIAAGDGKHIDLELPGTGNLLKPLVAGIERHAPLAIMLAAASGMLLLDRLGVEHFYN
jgi:hypothetical protein